MTTDDAAHSQLLSLFSWDLMVPLANDHSDNLTRHTVT